MDVTAQNINNIPGINLSRNSPVALVVGANTFLGSHLVDKLLSKRIQVVGLADSLNGKKQNLKKAVENKDFHLISDLPLDFELERLDYLFIVPEKHLSIKRVLTIFRKSKCRLLLISSVALYGHKNKLEWLREIEAETAKAAYDNKSNARILRLGSVFGPRMEFDSLFGEFDPIIRLIHQALTDDLQKEAVMDFSSRALYIDDCTDLAVKCILAGATAQKIFDGVLPNPVKVSEIKQVLLDPVWYETRGFKPSELPPWQTPNLEKTIKFLNWYPKSNLVDGLKETMIFFKDNEIKVDKLEIEEEEQLSEQNKLEWSREKSESLEALKKGESENQQKEGRGLNNPFHFSSSWLFLSAVLILVSYSLIWPLASMSWGVLTFRYQLSESIKNLEKGDFEKSLFAIEQADLGISQAKSIYQSLDPLRKINLLNSQFELGDNLSNVATLSSSSAKNTILGIKSLYKSLSSITGERTDLPKQHFEDSKVYLTAADEDLAKSKALMADPDFKALIPGFLKSRIDNLSDKLNSYSDLVNKARALSILLPEVVGEGNKSYLVLLQNNNELRPTGGFIGSLARVSFEAGKLKKLEVSDVYAIDGQLKIHVEPPKEILTDLGQKDYFLRDSNWEPDFPTAARQAEWFYNKETGQRVEGVMALDISAAEDLLKVLGPLDLADYNEKVGADNLFERSITHAEVNFFPGTQAKKSFLTALTQGLFNKLFFLPNQNWPGIVTSLGKSLESKHMSIYLDNPRLFSYVVSQNWANIMPRAAEEKSSKMADFLAPVEANLGANKVNYYLDRIYKLETMIGKDGEVNQKFKISYTNRSPSIAFPGGKYKNRMRLYLPSGTKLTRILWGESNITGTAQSFVDYGRSGYSFLIELAPKEQKSLIVEYQIPQKLKFENGKALYRLDVVKQAGTSKDLFEWSISYPLNMKIVSGSRSNKSAIAPQEQVITTDLSKNRSFEVEFSK